MFINGSQNRLSILNLRNILNFAASICCWDLKVHSFEMILVNLQTSKSLHLLLINLDLLNELSRLASVHCISAQFSSLNNHTVILQLNIVFNHHIVLYDAVLSYLDKVSYVLSLDYASLVYIAVFSYLGRWVLILIVKSWLNQDSFPNNTKIPNLYHCQIRSKNNLWTEKNFFCQNVFWVF